MQVSALWSKVAAEATCVSYGSWLSSSASAGRFLLIVLSILAAQPLHLVQSRQPILSFSGAGLVNWFC